MIEYEHHETTASAAESLKKHVSEVLEEIIAFAASRNLMLENEYQMHICHGQQSGSGGTIGLFVAPIEQGQCCGLCGGGARVDHSHLKVNELLRFPKIICVGLPGVDFRKVFTDVESHFVYYLDEASAEVFDFNQFTYHVRSIVEREKRVVLAGSAGFKVLNTFLTSRIEWVPDVVIALKTDTPTICSSFVKEGYLNLWKQSLIKKPDLIVQVGYAPHVDD